MTNVEQYNKVLEAIVTEDIIKDTEVAKFTILCDMAMSLACIADVMMEEHKWKGMETDHAHS